MMKQDNLTWTSIDPASMPKAQKKLYDIYKAQREAARKAKEAFEASMQEAAPDGKRFVFGYNFGKLSIAVTEAKTAPKSTNMSQALSLSDYLKTQRANGHAV